MSVIHLIHGFMGFGKTTLSEELAKKYNAKHFAIDQVILDKFCRNPSNFDKAYQEADDYIWQETAKAEEQATLLWKEHGKDIAISKSLCRFYWKILTREIFCLSCFCSKKSVQNRSNL